MNNDRLMTVQEVAQMCQVTPRRILDACRAGELQSINMGRGTKHVWERRFTPEAIKHWLQTLTEQTKEPQIL